MNDEAQKRSRDGVPAQRHGPDESPRSADRSRAGDSRLKQAMSGVGSIDNDPGNEDPGSLVEELSRPSTASGAPSRPQAEPAYDVPDVNLPDRKKPGR